MPPALGSRVDNEARPRGLHRQGLGPVVEVTLSGSASRGPSPAGSEEVEQGPAGSAQRRSRSAWL